jgi:hypothetical protein
LSQIKIAEEVRQTRFPRLGGNISDLWSDRNVMLHDDVVEDTLEAVIKSQQVPITEEPAMVLVSSEIRETSDESTEVTTIKVTSVNLPRSFYSLNDTTSTNNIQTKTNQNENTTSLHLSLRKSLLSDDNCVNKDRWQWATNEVIIIILISSLSVIFIIITVATVIIKVKE